MTLNFPDWSPYMYYSSGNYEAFARPRKPDPRRPPKLPHLWPPKLLHLAGVS